MPTIPLFDSNSVADAAHRVQAPGGYEWWYFDAEDPATDTQIVAIFLEGFVFHPGYLRAYQHYIRRPTQTPPPVAADFPCAYFVVYRGGRILHQFMTQYPRSAFTAATDRVSVRIGRNALDHDGRALRLHLEGTPWALTWKGPKLATDQSLVADFSFTPRYGHAPDERHFLSRAMTGAEHHWVLANPLCAVTGSISLSATGETIEFTGRGYHDHNYGTGPLGPGLRRWIWGRVLDEDRVSTFHYALPRATTLPPELHLVTVDPGGFREHSEVTVSADWSRRSGTGLPYPATLHFGEVLGLHTPRVLDAAPFYMRIQYQAETPSGSGTAFCEVAYPHRLRWPILGRMIEMSIDQRTLSQGQDR